MKWMLNKYPISLYQYRVLQDKWSLATSRSRRMSLWVLRDSWRALRSFRRMSSKLVLWWPRRPLRCPDPTTCTANMRASWAGESRCIQSTCPSMCHLAFHIKTRYLDCFHRGVYIVMVLKPLLCNQEHSIRFALDDFCERINILS